MTASRLSLIKQSVLAAVALLLMVLFSHAGYAKDISQRELLQRLDTHQAPLIVDVRRPDEFTAGHVPNAINIPHTEMQQRLHDLGANPHNEIVVYCESGRRAAIARLHPPRHQP